MCMNLITVDLFPICFNIIDEPCVYRIRRMDQTLALRWCKPLTRMKINISLCSLTLQLAHWYDALQIALINVLQLFTRPLMSDHVSRLTYWFFFTSSVFAAYADAVVAVSCCGGTCWKMSFPKSSNCVTKPPLRQRRRPTTNKSSDWWILVGTLGVCAPCTKSLIN